MALQYIAQQGRYLLRIAGVWTGYAQVYLEVHRRLGDIRYGGVCEFVVRGVNQSVVSHVIKLGHAQSYPLHAAYFAARQDDQVVLPEGWIEHQVDAAEEIRKRVLEREPHDKAYSTDADDQQTNIYAQVLQDKDKSKQEESKRAQRIQQGYEQVIQLILGFLRVPRKPPEYNLFHDPPRQIRSRGDKHREI